MKTSFEKDKAQNTTATYKEAIRFYQRLAKQYEQIEMSEVGKTDSGKPLHVVVYSKDGIFDPVALRKAGKVILFINNAIHPGEPCGVDASMMLLRDYAASAKLNRYLKDVVLVCVPFYNIGGGLNRNSTSRANQDGPCSYGFRGNARNYDLNRDFVKCDTENASSFNRLFNQWRPHVMVDNHTSNGADYQYTMTLIATQKDKLSPALAGYMTEQLLPSLYKDMKAADWEMVPYVYARKTPDEGIMGFLDLPRYSSGYAALHNCISFMPETHMLKPYRDRVLSTYAFMQVMIKTLAKQKTAVLEAKKKADRSVQNKKRFDLNWTVDYDQVERLRFKGYEAKYKPSAVTGQSRLYYDRSAPYEKEIPFYNSYKSSLSIKKPDYYILPQAYSALAERMINNGVSVEKLGADKMLDVMMYRIGEFETVKNAYEGHYLHYNLSVDSMRLEWPFFEGDYVIRTNQIQNRYIIETLEPQAPDSFFAWNFFDSILMQKEHFSAYVFEDVAAELIAEDAKLRAAFEAKKSGDEVFAEDAHAQLNWIYLQSPHYERTHQVYPVARYNGDLLDLEPND